MSAPAIHPDAILAALPDFDADVVCEFKDGCELPAVWRVVAHGIRTGEDTCSVRTYLMCDPCLSAMRRICEDKFRRFPIGLCACGRRFRQVSDVIQSVVAL
ncbi:hypothetical protein SEA_BEARBQ_62 [Gordonia phage BearBQ]|nr:hypothetical protein SEA_BEARBQ_62 [Gordonia phage BearBQ]